MEIVQHYTLLNFWDHLIFLNRLVSTKSFSATKCGKPHMFSSPALAERCWKVKPLSNLMFGQLSVLVHLPNQSSPRGPTPVRPGLVHKFYKRIFGSSLADALWRTNFANIGCNSFVNIVAVKVQGARHRIGWKSSDELKSFSQDERKTK